jgi:hypothetical protein
MRIFFPGSWRDNMRLRVKIGAFLAPIALEMMKLHNNFAATTGSG